MEVKLLDLQAQYAQIQDEVNAAVLEVLRDQNFIQGKQVAQFEQEFGRYLGSPHALGVASGSDALLLAMMALGIGPGDAVITTAYSFFATASAITRVGAQPIFLDIDPVTYNLDVQQLEQLLSECRRSRTRKGQVLKDPSGKLRVAAVMPVHLYGRCCDMTTIMRLAGEYGLKVVEDAAQSIGSSVGGKSAGTWGDIGCFSFYPSKNLGAAGDAGAVVANDPELADYLKLLREHGARPRYLHHHVGINSRLDTIQAAVLGVKLRHLEQWNEARRKCATHYVELMEKARIVARTPAELEAGLVQPPETTLGREHNFHQFVIRSTKRDAIVAAMESRRVGHAVYYPLPLHRQPCFEKLGLGGAVCPKAEAASQQTLALPMYAELAAAKQEVVVDCLAEAARKSVAARA